MSSPSDITLGRWSQLETLFDQAVDLDPEQRSAFLDASCRGDDVMRREVIALLQANDTGGARVQSLIKDAASQALTSPATASNRMGPYELIRAIGNGGMGSVHLAERKDAEFEQRVAIKLLHKTMVTPELLARFRSERQILADLNHPNIAHLIDGGTTDDGVPYIVMEYVEGKPINQYCDDNQLTIAKRLDLFRQVCSAIEMAHQNLIVHRDIKPNNILVARDGTPKLLDFGIAKSLAELTDSDNLTRQGDRLLTPNHASPEQVAGKPVTTASDVYSLGVLLYELLCGVCPFNLNRCTPAQMERIVTEVQAQSPSRLLAMSRETVPELGRTRCHEPEAVAMDRGVSADKLRRELAGDLDNIVLMALHKDRDRRYRSVGRLSEDVQRYLRGLPVTARADSWRYRAGKFIKRNRWAVMTGAAFVFSLAAFSMFAAFQANRLALKNDSLQAAKLFSKEIVLGADPFRTSDGDVPNMLEVLEAASRRLESPALRMAPVDVADLQDTMGRVYFRYGRVDEARDFLNKALGTLGSELGRESPGLVLTLVALGRLELEESNYDDARAHLDRALVISRSQFAGPSHALALSQHFMANYHRDTGDRDRAEALYRQSIATYEALGTQFNRGRALVLREFGLQLKNSFRSREAITVTEQALELDRVQFGPKHTFVAHDLENLGLNWHRLGNNAEAGRLLEEALAIHESWDARTPGVREKLALTIRSLARLREAEEDYQRAMVLNARSLVLMIEKHTLAKWEVGKSFYGLGVSMQGQGRNSEAEAFFMDAIHAYEQDALSQPKQITEVNSRFGQFLLDAGRLDEAEERFSVSVRVMSESLSDEALARNWQVGDAHSGLGAVYLAAGRMSQARGELELAIEILNATGLPSDHKLVIRTRDRLNAVMQRQHESAP